MMGNNIQLIVLIIMYIGDKMVNLKYVAIDFDGTIVTHEYPRIGKPVPYALETIKSLQENGVKLILWTMRSGEELQAAVDYCAKNGVVFYGVNQNPDQHTWTKSPKAYAPVYIDDAALGCPLIEDEYSNRPYVDWFKVCELLGLEIITN